MLDGQFMQDIRDSWVDDIGPVYDQRNCGNCWSASFVKVLTAVTNRHVPKVTLSHYAAGDPNGKIDLSINQLTMCTSQGFYQKLKDTKDLDFNQYTDFKFPGLPRVHTDAFRLYGCKGGSWEGAMFSMFNANDAKHQTFANFIRENLENGRFMSHIQMNGIDRQINEMKDY
jgi:hypothetical protein